MIFRVVLMIKKVRIRKDMYWIFLVKFIVVNFLGMDSGRVKLVYNEFILMGKVKE